MSEDIIITDVRSMPKIKRSKNIEFRAIMCLNKPKSKPRCPVIYTTKGRDRFH